VAWGPVQARNQRNDRHLTVPDIPANAASVPATGARASRSLDYPPRYALRTYERLGAARRAHAA